MTYRFASREQFKVSSSEPPGREGEYHDARPQHPRRLWARPSVRPLPVLVKGARRYRDRLPKRVKRGHLCAGCGALDAVPHELEHVVVEGSPFDRPDRLGGGAQDEVLEGLVDVVLVRDGQPALRPVTEGDRAHGGQRERRVLPLDLGVLEPVEVCSGKFGCEWHAHTPM